MADTTSKLLKTNPDDPAFIALIKTLKQGDTFEVEDGTLEVEAIFDVPTHFTFHQRIFPAGMILHRPGKALRIYIEAERFGLKPKEVEPGFFNDSQIAESGVVLPPDPLTQFQEK